MAKITWDDLKVEKQNSLYAEWLRGLDALGDRIVTLQGNCNCGFEGELDDYINYLEQMYVGEGTLLYPLDLIANFNAHQEIDLSVYNDMISDLETKYQKAFNTNNAKQKEAER